MVDCYEELTETCDPECRESFEAGFNFTYEMIEEECDLLDVPVCEAEIARQCILHLWEIVDIAEDFQTACKYDPWPQYPFILHSYSI